MEFGLGGHYRSPEVNSTSIFKTASRSAIFCMYAPMTSIINTYYLNLTSAGIEGHWRSK